MKKMNKFVSMLLVVAMIFAMSISAFAAHPDMGTTVGSATLTIKIDGVNRLVNRPISGVTLKDGLNNLNATMSLNLVWKDAVDYYDSTITHQALQSLYGYQTTYATTTELTNNTYTDYNNVSYTVDEEDKVMNGYYLLGTDTAVNPATQEEATRYHYLYIGKGWTYSLANSSAEIYDYMCCYVLNGQNIVLEYSLQPSDWYTFDQLG